MFHKVKKVTPMSNFILLIEFADDERRRYDVKPLFEKWAVFRSLADDRLFEKVQVDSGGYGISWNDDIDLSCDELYYNGVA